MKLWRYSGTLLTATGILHTVLALVLEWDSLAGMVRDGLAHSVGDDFRRAFAFWFLVCGILLIFFGQTLQHYIKREQKPAPLWLGYAILGFSIAGCVVEPISGFMLFIPQALIIILAKR